VRNCSFSGGPATSPATIASALSAGVTGVRTGTKPASPANHSLTASSDGTGVGSTLCESVGLGLGIAGTAGGAITPLAKGWASSWVGTPQDTNARHRAAVALQAPTQRREIFRLSQHLFMFMDTSFTSAHWKVAIFLFVGNRDLHNEACAVRFNALNAQFNFEQMRLLNCNRQTKACT